MGKRKDFPWQGENNQLSLEYKANGFTRNAKRIIAKSQSLEGFDPPYLDLHGRKGGNLVFFTWQDETNKII